MAHNLPTHSTLLFLLVLITLAALPVLTYPLWADQGTFAVIGRSILAGGTPYVTVWDVKPPAVYYVYALAIGLGGENVSAVHGIDLVLVPLTGLALYSLGRRLAGRRLGLWTVLIFGVLYFRHDFWVLAQNDGIAILPMTLAALCTVRVGDADVSSRKALRDALLAGMFSALSLWFKYPYVLFIITAVVGGYLLQRWGVPARRMLAEVLAFLAGGLLVGLGGLAFLAAIGALDAFLSSVRVAAGYSAMLYQGEAFVETMRLPVIDQLYSWAWVLWLVVLWPVRRGQASPPRLRRQWPVVWLWLLGTLGAVVIQARGYRYHWLPMIPPLALLAADSLDRLLTAIARRLSGQRTALAYAVLTGAAVLSLMGLIVTKTYGTAWPYLTGRLSQLEYWHTFELFADTYVPADSLQLADYLRERMPPDSDLFIWGFRPEIYYLSHLQPATRFLHTLPMICEWCPPEWRDEVVAELQAKSPLYVLVVHSDVPLERLDKDSYALLQDFPELNGWLRANYRQETSVGNVLVWRRIT